MPFKKGENGSGGRKKGGKNKQRLIRYKPKNWTKTTIHNTFDQEEIEHRLNNNLPLDDLFDKLDSKYGKRKNNDKDV